MPNHSSVITESAREEIVNETAAVDAALTAHAALDWTAHGAAVQVANYLESSLDVAGRLVIAVNTNMGVLYVPCSTSPSGPGP
jgi:hypothetical protein